jgi:hypothetical protein
VPLVPSVPLQPPEAVQELALVELQLSVAALPLWTDVGFAVRVAVGTTLIPAFSTGLVPSGPLHVSTKVEFLVRGPVLCVPLGANVPLQAFEAVHDVASVELQVRVAEPPLSTAPALVIKATVGTAASTAPIHIQDSARAAAALVIFETIDRICAAPHCLPSYHAPEPALLII